MLLCTVSNTEAHQIILEICAYKESVTSGDLNDSGFYRVSRKKFQLYNIQQFISIFCNWLPRVFHNKNFLPFHFENS